MEPIYITRTNQKLYFARLHLESLNKALHGTGWSKHATIESFNESVLFHMACGYHSFLREIAEQYRVPPGDVEDFEGLQQALDSKGIEAPELSELRVLEEDPDSWLHKMLRAYEACWNAVDKPIPLDAHNSLSEIHVVQINPDHADDAELVAQFEHWLNELRMMLDRLRAGMLEW